MKIRKLQVHKTFFCTGTSMPVLEILLKNITDLLFCDFGAKSPVRKVGQAVSVGQNSFCLTETQLAMFV